ncbi:error-prone DNA polymerase [Flavihumibacter solisilvae]|uniref:Error-prone DNA polymerase n=1 Tax=Flavihumibacter solisilvae TaxID=1349421 RepID=A0A0C1ISI3_9BACT|nr:error-prone DNA polymerase [Flavihumibacter solisilvae]KIC93404.1 DNA polymerase [Flavihumibacter solisilvae]
MAYTELQVTTNFSFLRGASHPEELVEQAASMGYREIAITDRNSFAGIVRAHAAARTNNIRIIPACRLDLLDGPSLLAYPATLAAYSRLSSIITTGNLRAEKGQCHLYKSDLFGNSDDIKLVIVPPDKLNHGFDFDAAFKNDLGEYKSAFGKELHVAASRRYNGDDGKQLFRLAQLSREFELPLVATNDVHYHIPGRRQLQDIVTCVREKCTIYTAGYRLHANAERYLKPIGEMERLFRQYPEALNCTQEIISACSFSLDQLKYHYPKEITTEGRTPQEELTFLAWRGAHERYGNTIPQKICDSIEYELAFMEQMNYAEYFLTVYDIVRYAREQNILCQGRGSAANSTVCYCLGITSVDPSKFDLLFERFISSARNEPPDIDVDFEHERREEVIQYIYRKYGRERAAIVATVTQQHQKGAIRDVGKAMGLSVDTINRLSGAIWEFTEEWFEGKRLTEQGLNPDDRHLRKVLQLTGEFMGFPRQLGQHTGGFVITEGRLSDLCPILNARMENRTCIEWNKDDIDALGFLKIDVLALGMLTCIRKAFDLAKAHYGLDLTLANIPQDDPEVYEMICKADTIGVFQIESRAQQSMLPRLRPRNFYDLVIEVAIVRPGPIQGDMVHPYLRRRNGEEPVEYPSKELEEILRRTLGVPLFQEQAMKIAIVAAGFTPAEADQLRRSMATFKVQGMVKKFEDKLITGMLKNGYSAEYAQRVFKQLEGFGSYGFPESHAASFALLVYVSSWIKHYYPDVFACALLNSMPMGFYQPSQIVIDAEKHGVEVRPVDINYSEWDNLLEENTGKYCALRLGFRQVKGLRQEDIIFLLAGRGEGYETIDQLKTLGLSLSVLEKLAGADAFRSVGLDRRQALWEVSAKDRPVGLFEGRKSMDDQVENIQLPLMQVSEHVVQDYITTSLSLKAHPVSFLRDKLSRLGVMAAKDLGASADGDSVKIAGLVLVRQRPGTAGGVCFMTIEDESGFANLVIFQNLFETYRKAILQSRLIMVEGKLQRVGEVIHVIVSSCHDYTRLLRELTPALKDNIPVNTPARGDDKSAPPGQRKKTSTSLSIQTRIFPEARNFK